MRVRRGPARVPSGRRLTTWVLAEACGGFHAREPAVTAVATAGYLTTELGDPVGAHLRTGTGIRHVPAAAGHDHVTEIVHTLAYAPPVRAPALAASLTGLAAAAHHPGIVVVVAGLLDGFAPPALPPAVLPALPPLATSSPSAPGLFPAAMPGALPPPVPAWEGPLRRLAGRHRVLVVQTRPFPRPGHPGLPPEVRHAARSARCVAGVRHAVPRRRQSDIAAAVRRAGAAHLVLPTDSDGLDEVITHVREQRRLARFAARR